MNYRIAKISKSNLTHYHFIKSITHNKSSNILLSFSNSLVKVCKSFLNSIFTPTKYSYDEISDTHKPYNDNYYFRDTTDLQLKASTRTFL